MSNQITKQHLEFVREAKDSFERVLNAETYTNTDETLIALRMGIDRDCVLVYELGDCIANFVQQMEAKPNPRKAVRNFAYDMEQQLLMNDHKPGWKDEHVEFLYKQMILNTAKLVKAIGAESDKDEITRRCANIANFAMMIADNYGTVREEK